MQLNITDTTPLYKIKLFSGLLGLCSSHDRNVLGTGAALRLGPLLAAFLQRHMTLSRVPRHDSSNGSFLLLQLPLLR